MQPMPAPFDANSLLAYILVASPFPYFLQGGIVRRRCVDSAGGFDPELLRSQDYGFLVQLARRFPVIKLKDHTYLHRQGSHDRGPMNLLHSAAERSHHWVRYGRILWMKWKPQLDLMDHLPKDTNGCRQLFTAENRRDARVCRCAALYFKGIWGELLEELDRAFEDFPPGEPCGQFASMIWVNAILRLRAPLYLELDGTPIWQSLRHKLKGPAAAYLGALMVHAFTLMRNNATTEQPSLKSAQIARMLKDLTTGV